jgi:DnaJ like chaperone protein
MSYSKWIGGALGWAMGGPIGGLLGFAIGYIADDSTFKGSKSNASGQRNYEQYRHHTRSGDFSSALLVLSAAIMKADSRLMKSELDYIREFYRKQFGEAAAAQQIGVLKDLLKRDIQVREVCEQIRYYMEHSMRLQLMYYLFGLASADGKVDKSEMHLIEQIAGYLGLSEKDYESLKAMHYKDTDGAYKILETSKDASDDEVKKAYRRMAMKYHPDKVRGLGEQHEKSAQEKFIKVQQAYEQIKAERGMK